MHKNMREIKYDEQQKKCLKRVKFRILWASLTSIIVSQKTKTKQFFSPSGIGLIIRSVITPIH